MSSIFNTRVSVGHSVNSKRVKTAKLGRKRFENFKVLDGDNKNGDYYTVAVMKNKYRSEEQVDRVELIAIDIDDIEPREVRALEKKVFHSGLECVMHTTYSHTELKPKWRIILKPSRAMTDREHKCVVPQLAVYLGIEEFDRVSMTSCNPMFFPMVHEDRLGSERFIYYEGNPVDIDPYLMAMINDETPDEYVSETAQYDPMPIPGALSEANWLEAVLTSYPASACADYTAWKNVGKALWHQTDGRAFDVWLAWSRQNTEKHGQKISEDEMRNKKWPSFKPKPERTSLITLRSLLNTVVSGSSRTVLALAYRRMLAQMTEPAELARLLADIKDDKFLTGANRRIVGMSFKEASKRVNGDDMTLGEAMMAVGRDSALSGTKEFFYNRYLFNEGESQYYDIHTKRPVPITSMNYMYGSHMPPSNSGERKIVHKVLTNETDGYVKPRVMHGYAYEVDSDMVIERDNHHYLNQFIPSSWPEAEEGFSEDNDLDIRIRTMVHRHFQLLCNGDEILKRMLLQHLGHLRQNPNKRLHFAYAVSSYFHGVGKTTLRHLYETVLGKEQVNVLAATNIAEDFNSYVSAPKLMSFIEEFEFDTRREQNRAIKKMKDLITSDSISVRRMRTDPIRTDTYTAYAIFSNDEYVLGHESTGRRWVPIVVEAANEEQCSEVLGMQHERFYTEYYALMRDHPERFVAYFESISLDGFQTERPPVTKQKTVFIDNQPAMRVLRILQELIENEASLDMTDDYMLMNSAVKMVRNYIDYREDADTEELEGHSARQIRNLISRALKSAGYKQLSTAHDRVRLPTVDSDRVRLSDIWIKNVIVRESPLAVPQLRKLIRKTDKARRLRNDQEKIVRMDRQPWEAIP